MLDPFLSNILVCPACKGPLQATEKSLQCATCQLAYPVEDGIPVMLIDQAQKMGVSGES